MGYCYALVGGTRLLVCDNCSHAGGVRKVSCKYGYCPANALCAACRKNPDIKAKVADYCEANCKAASARFAAIEAAEKAALAAGELLFRSAAGRSECDVYLVELTFRGADGSTVERLVSKSVYELAHGEKWKPDGKGFFTLSDLDAIGGAA